MRGCVVWCQISVGQSEMIEVGNEVVYKSTLFSNVRRIGRVLKKGSLP